MIEITAHAAQRYCERVSPMPLVDARAEIGSHCRAIEVAAAFGCSTVRLGNGARLVLDGSRVVTVYARGWLPRAIRGSEQSA